MSSLIETIDRTLTNIGREPRDVLIETIESFNAMDLSDEEEICALATALASCAMTSHRRHVGKYLEAVRVWALELAEEASPEPPRLRTHPVSRRVAEGAGLMIEGTEQLIGIMHDAGVGLQDRLVAELTLVARILGRQDANTINIVIQSVGDALTNPTFHRGDIVQVALRDIVASPSIPLAAMSPRGTA
jgi:hypothetical protein